MAWPKGVPRPEGAGRKKGTPNKMSTNLNAICEAKGINPFEALLEMTKHEDPNIKMQALKEVCQYVLPKRKAVEHTGVVNLELSKKAEEFAQLPRDEQIRLAEAEVLRLKGSSES